MTALLGLLALAGYQNRDKLADLLHGASGKPLSQYGGRASGGMCNLYSMTKNVDATSAYEPS